MFPSLDAASHRQVDINFHGVDYILTASTTANCDTLSVEVEQRSDASRWRGDFTSRCEEHMEGGEGECCHWAYHGQPPHA